MPGKWMIAATEEMLTTAPPCPAAQLGGIEVDHQRGDLDAGVVDQDVEAAQLADRPGDGALPAGVVGHVELDEARGRAGLAQARDGLLAVTLENVADHHRGTGPGERLGHARSQPARSAGYQCLASSQVVHAHSKLLGSPLAST